MAKKIKYLIFFFKSQNPNLDQIFFSLVLSTNFLISFFEGVLNINAINNITVRTVKEKITGTMIKTNKFYLFI